MKQVILHRSALRPRQGPVGDSNTRKLANSYFKFKQFTIEQSACSMKVCTEACLFGAWLAEYLESHPLTTALDIGAGTGLLTLMLAQTGKLSAIDALEIDPAAAAQAGENLAASPWASLVRIIHGDALNYAFQRNYDLVFSNPPFFEQSLRSPDPGKNLAKHESELDFDSLVRLTEKLLMPGGLLAVLIPFERADKLIDRAAGSGLRIIRRADVKQTEKHRPFRAMLLFQDAGTGSGVVEAETILIRRAGEYSDRFQQLLRPYYLFL
jgi:tRNA1Val (adenine37-N6)-methyltransferase